NYALAFVLFALVAGVWGILQPSSDPVVGDLIPGLPAAEAGLKENDKIVSIDGNSVHSWEEMAKFIHEHPEMKVNLEVSREIRPKEPAQTVKLTLTPKRDPQLGIGLIGIMPRVDKIRPGFQGSLTAAYRDIKIWTVQPLKYLSSKLRRFEGPKELSG